MVTDCRKREQMPAATPAPEHFNVGMIGPDTLCISMPDTAETEAVLKEMAIGKTTKLQFANPRRSKGYTKSDVAVRTVEIVFDDESETPFAWNFPARVFHGRLPAQGEVKRMFVALNVAARSPVLQRRHHRRGKRITICAHD
jgi:hypothetical protein